MNAINELQTLWLYLSDAPLLGRLFLACIEMPILAALVWLSIRTGFVQSPRWRALLWLLVLAKPLIVLAFGSFVPVVQIEATPQMSTIPAGHLSTSSPLNSETTQTERVSQTSGVTPSASVPLAEPWLTQRNLLLAWTLGICLMGAYSILDRIRLYRLLARATPVSKELTTRYRQLATDLKLRTYPSLLLTDTLESPALAGILQPVILLPEWLGTEGWTPKLEWSLRHELMHWHLRDPWANGLRQIAQIVFFFHPLMWWVGKQWQNAAELACDRAVIASEDDVDVYAGSLFQILTEIHGRRQGLFAGALFATRTQIGTRIAALLGNPLRYPARLYGWGRVVLAIIIIAALGIGGSIVVAQSETAGNDVQANIRKAIDLLSVTSEQERDKVNTVFDIVKAQPPQSALMELCKELKSTVATKRRSAVYILGALQWEDPSPAFPPLRELLSHQEALTRGMAALTLGTLADKASYESIVSMAREDKDPYARRCAAYALGELGDIKALEPLESIRQDKDPNVAANAENATDRLKFLRDNADAKGDAQKVVRGIWIISGSLPWDTERLQRAVSMIQSSDAGIQKSILDKAAESTSVAIKNSVDYARNEMGKTASVSTIPPDTPSTDVPRNIRNAIDMLSVTSEFERDKIRKVLDLVKAQPSQAALTELCAGLKSEIATKRQSAIYILGALPWEDPSPAFPPLRELLSHKEVPTRGMTALTLGTLADAASYEPIVRMAREDENPYARRCAAYALGELGDVKALEPLESIRQDKDFNVAANATNAIERLNYLKENTDATGDAQKVVRGIWIISGSVPWDTERLQRAVSMIQSCEAGLQKTILDKAAESTSVAIKNSVAYARKELEKAPTTSNTSTTTSSTENKIPADTNYNFNLYLSNATTVNDLDIKIFLDGKRVVNDKLKGCQDFTQPAPFMKYACQLTPGTHTLKVSSEKGQSAIEKQFIATEHNWVVISYLDESTPTAEPSKPKSPKSFSFSIQDRPIAVK